MILEHREWNSRRKQRSDYVGPPRTWEEFLIYPVWLCLLYFILLLCFILFVIYKWNWKTLEKLSEKMLVPNINLRKLLWVIKECVATQWDHLGDHGNNPNKSWLGLTQLVEWKRVG